MNITRSKAGKPIYSGPVIITKIPHGITLQEKRSKGADKRRSILYVELTHLEFLKLFKVYLQGKVNKRVVDVLAWVINKVIEK